MAEMTMGAVFQIRGVVGRKESYQRKDKQTGKVDGLGYNIRVDYMGGACELFGGNAEKLMAVCPEVGEEAVVNGVLEARGQGMYQLRPLQIATPKAGR